MARTQTPNHQMAPAGTGFEQQCANAVAEYRRQLGDFVQEYRDGINTLSTTHETNIGQWLADPNRTEAGFEERIAEPGETIDHLVTYTDFNTRWATDTARRQFGRVLPIQDQRLLVEAQRSARGWGVQDPRVQSLLSGASSREARDVMEASLDRITLRHFEQRADMYGDQDPRAQSLLDGLSCPEARSAIEASRESQAILKPFREKAKAWQARDGSIEEVVEALRKAPDPQYLAGMIASLDVGVWEHAQRRHRARGLEDQGTQEMLDNASNPNSRAAMEMLLSRRPRLMFEGRSNLFNTIYTLAGGAYRPAGAGAGGNAGARPRTGPTPGGGAGGGRTRQQAPPRQGPRPHQGRTRQQPPPNQGSRQQHGGRTGQQPPPNQGPRTNQGRTGGQGQPPPSQGRNTTGQQPPPSQEQTRPSASEGDLYSDLDIDKDATEREIQLAYRRLAKANHPDIGGDEAKFKEVLRAFDILDDPQKRQEYDSLTDPKHRSWYRRFGSMQGYRE